MALISLSQIRRHRVSRGVGDGLRHGSASLRRGEVSGEVVGERWLACDERGELRRARGVCEPRDAQRLAALAEEVLRGEQCEVTGKK